MPTLAINLLEQQQSRLSRLNQANLVVSVVVGTIIGLELLVGVFLLSAKTIRNGEKQSLSTETAQLQNNIADLNKESVSQYPGLSLAAAGKSYQHSLEAANGLIDNHKYFTLYLSEIALNTPSSVVYTSFSSSGTNQISVIGRASSYSEVSRLAESFKGLSFAKNVSIQDAKQEQKGSDVVRFTLGIELKSAKELNLLPKPGGANNGTSINVPANTKPANGKSLPVSQPTVVGGNGAGSGGT